MKFPGEGLHSSEADHRDKYLTVSLGESRLGIPVGRVKEIIECGAISGLPMAPAAVRGTIRLRGKVVPVVDLSVRFGREPAEIGQRSCIIIADVEGGRFHQRFEVGVLVDAVNEVVDIRPDAIEASPSMDGAIYSDFTSGMGRIRDAFVLLLRVDALVDFAGLVQIAHAPLATECGKGE